MGTPALYLPPRLSNDKIIDFIGSLDLPTPTKVEPLQVTAEYHAIYLVHFDRDHSAEIPSNDRNQDGSVTLVLRISGRHLPGYKTRNEVGCMAWVRKHTKIPVPAVIRWSDHEDNATGHEFTLLSMAPGVSVDKIYKDLNAFQKRRLVEQLVDFLAQLHANRRPSTIAGCIPLPNGKIGFGPLIDETFWQAPDLALYFPGDTLKTMNPITHQHGAYEDLTHYISDCCRRYRHAMEKHASLEPFRDMIPKMDRFIDDISARHNRDLINGKNMCFLAHRDLHFANVMCDPSNEDLRITAVLDWEFAGFVPMWRWNPSRAFLWNGSADESANPEKYALFKVFEDVCEEKGLAHMLEDLKPNKEQETVQNAIGHIRGIVEVCPRGQQQDKVEQWKQNALNAMAFFEKKNEKK